MDKVTRDLIEAFRDTLEEVHDQHIYDRDDEHPDDCCYCSLVAQADAWLLAHPAIDDKSEDKLPDELPDEVAFAFYVPVYVSMEIDPDSNRYLVQSVNVDDEVSIERELMSPAPWLDSVDGEKPKNWTGAILKKAISDAEDGQAWPSWEFGF